MGLLIRILLLTLSVGAVVSIFPQDSPQRNASVIAGLDHIPIAVKNLEAAVARYRALGFALKPGRPHKNGIRNQHVKFPDGTELELITVAEARDPLTAAYRRHLASGDGPAFLAFYAPVMDALAMRLDGAGRAYDRAGSLLTFPGTDTLRYVFFGPRNHSPTDRPAHFAHPNTTESLIGVWLAGDDFSAERGLFRLLDVTISEETVYTPQRLRVPVARLREGEVFFLPGSRQLTTGRRIIGATLRVSNLDAVRQALEGTNLEVPRTIEHHRGTSLFLPPGMTHGIWLEFRETVDR